MYALHLKPGREKSLRRRHPWVFSGAVARIEGRPMAGDSVAVHAADGTFLAAAAYSPESQIRARVWTWTRTTIDEEFFRSRIHAAAARRNVLLAEGGTNAVRLLHGEADGLPGVVADRFGDIVVLQLGSAGADRWRGAIADALAELNGVACVWEKSDADVRELEGLPPLNGLLRGTEPADPVVITENGLHYEVGFRTGHKTGFYLDQRDNRALVRRLAANCAVLDCFCYSGGFALNAARGGARSVTAIDRSADALGAAHRHAARNGLTDIEWLEADVFAWLRQARDQGRTYDLIVLDPPKLAPSAAHAEKAARAYKDINLLGFRLLRPGGVLMTYSCSGGISADLFHKIIAGAALDAGVDAGIESWLHAGMDHPVALNVPESEYLKGLVCRIR